MAIRVCNPEDAPWLIAAPVLECMTVCRAFLPSATMNKSIMSGTWKPTGLTRSKRHEVEWHDSVRQAAWAAITTRFSHSMHLFRASTSLARRWSQATRSITSHRTVFAFSKFSTHSPHAILPATSQDTRILINKPLREPTSEYIQAPQIQTYLETAN